MSNLLIRNRRATQSILHCCGETDSGIFGSLQPALHQVLHGHRLHCMVRIHAHANDARRVLVSMPACIQLSQQHHILLVMSCWQGAHWYNTPGVPVR